jgi:surface antigen
VRANVLAHVVVSSFLLAGLFAASVVEAPMALAVAPLTTPCGPLANYSCLSSTGYDGQPVWGSDPGHNCVSYAAYRLLQNGLSVQPWSPIGDAADWEGHVPPNEVNKTPAVGAIAWWGKEVAGGAGHVAYVEAVVGNSSVWISEDSYYPYGKWAAAGGYSQVEEIPASKPDEYLHIHDPLWFSTTQLPGFTPGHLYQTTLALTGPALTGITGTPTFSLAAGKLPNGLSLSIWGGISGTPSASSPATFTVRAADAEGSETSQVFSLSAQPLAVPSVSQLSVKVDKQGEEITFSFQDENSVGAEGC